MNVFYLNLLTTPTDPLNDIMTGMMGWILPIFMIIMAAVAIKFLISGELRAAITFGFVAIIVGAFSTLGPTFFGGEGIFTQASLEIANEIRENVDETYYLTEEIVEENIEEDLAYLTHEGEYESYEATFSWSFLFVFAISMFGALLVFSIYMIIIKISSKKNENENNENDLKNNILNEIKDTELSEIDKFKLLVSDCITKVSKLEISKEIKNNLNNALKTTIDNLIERNDETSINKLKGYYIPEILRLIDKYNKLASNNIKSNSVKVAKEQIINSFVQFTDALNILHQNHVDKDATDASIAAQTLKSKLTLDGLTKSKLIKED